MNLTLREAHPTDLPAVAELFGLYRQFYEQPPTARWRRTSSPSACSAASRSSSCIDAGADGLMGFVQLYPTFCSVEAQPIYTLYDLFVRPGACKAGAGRQLLLAAEARAAADGMVRMDLTTARTNRTAQSLYKSLGWMRDDVFLAYSRRVGPSS